MTDASLFGARLAELRARKGVSAREMSLSLGLAPSYINMLETGKNYPSLPAILDICEYLGITPAEFFDEDNKDPAAIREIVRDLKSLDHESLELVRQLAQRLVKNNNERTMVI